jgi:hypothetical protein
MLKIDYREHDGRAVLSWAEDDGVLSWLEIIRRLVFDRADDAAQKNAYRLSLHWWSFTSLRGQFLEIFKTYGLAPESALEITQPAADLLRQSKRAADGYKLATSAVAVTEVNLRGRLKEIGLQRDLSPEQARNVCKIGRFGISRGIF